MQLIYKYECISLTHENIATRSTKCVLKESSRRGKDNEKLWTSRKCHTKLTQPDYK